MLLDFAQKSVKAPKLKKFVVSAGFYGIDRKNLSSSVKMENIEVLALNEADAQYQVETDIKRPPAFIKDVCRM